ncbi:hypothetical protein ACS126_18700 [Sphingobacterium lactis]|uniref:hypothetical protein n=1 Tax=Sphingobacterium lactis TaxID=797291 RepID=UPI003EC6A172
MNKKNEGFDPKEFLGAKQVSPLEQEKLLGGSAEPGEKEKEREKERERVKEEEEEEAEG